MAGQPAQRVEQHLASFVPGKAPETWPKGIAKRIPAGARLRFTIHYSNRTGKQEKDATKLTAAFDNSANNKSNPDPSKIVRWGDNTVDEMMDGWFEFVSPGI
ncbi:MAG: hypothetical protein WKF37_00940 [Bryobacteraceae bacterium]